MPTIKELAEACGVSQATVSQVLNNGNRPVRAQTREHVLRTARALDYQPSAVARGLARKRMNTIGLAFFHSEDSTDPNTFLMMLLDGVLLVSTRRKQTTMLCTINRWETAGRLPELSDGRCDGVLLLVPPIECPALEVLKQRKVPLVVVNGKPRSEGVSWIDVDNTRAAREMTEHLLRLGHKRIAFVRGSYNLLFSFVHERAEGYRQAMTAAGLHDPALSDFSTQQALALTLSDPGRPTALFCAYDAVALPVMEILQSRNICIPEDVSVVGFDDIPAARASRPLLTTMRQPTTQIGGQAAEMLWSLITGLEEQPRQETLSAEFVLRQSAAPPPDCG